MSTDHPQRIAAYQRVSSQEQIEGYSLAAQGRAIRDHFPSDTVIDYIDEGKSAASENIAKRPAFARMLTDVEAGKVDIVAVHKLDRFARNRTVAFEAFGRLDKARIGFVSISENYDFSTPLGQLSLTFLVGLAAFFSANLSLETRKGKGERKAQGLYNGHLPFGAMKDPDSRLPIPDRRSLVNGSTAYDGLLLAMQMCADGRSDGEITSALNTRGYLTGASVPGPWIRHTVGRILKNRFYVGDLPDGDGGWLPGKHEPLVPLELFERAQSARAMRGAHLSAHSSKPHNTYSLSGLVWCWYCLEAGAPNPKMRVQRTLNRARGFARVRCRKRMDAVGCPQSSVVLGILEDQVAAWLATIRITDAEVQVALDILASEGGEPDTTETERRQLRAYIASIGERRDWGHISREEYLVKYDEAQRKLAALTPRRITGHDIRAIAETLRRVFEDWQHATSEERHALLVPLVERIVVKDGKVAQIVPTQTASRLIVEWHL